MTGDICVLHVDDDPAFGELTAEFLKRENNHITVVTETEASAAIDRLEDDLEGDRHEIDCIVSDYDMPDMDGLELLTAVRERDAELPFILFTGKGSEEIAAEAITAGVTEYLQKGGAEQYVVLANRVVNVVEQHLATRAAERVERRLHEIAEKTDDMLWMFSSDWNETLFVNSAVEDIFGIPPERLYEQPQRFLETVHPDDRQLVERTIERLSEGNAVEIEHRIVHGDDQRWVWVQAEPIVDDRNRVDRIVGFVRDITERKERETHLQKAQEVGRLGWWKKEIPSDQIYWSEMIYDMWGADGEAGLLDHETFLEFVHPDDRPFVDEAWQAALEGQPYDIEHRIVTGDGDVRWMREIAEFEFDEKGDPIRAVGIAQDITDRKTRERILEKRRERLQVLFDEAPDALVVHDEAGNVLDMNRQTLENLGYTRSELASMNVADYEVGFDRDELIELWAEMDVGETLKDEGRHERKDGSTFPIEVWVNKIEIDGKPRFIAQARDITEQKEHERRLKRTRERYRSLFENNPLVLWEEDFSEAKRYADSIAERTDDFVAYLDENPEELRRIVERIDVIDVNRNAVEYYGADSKAALKDSLDQLQTDESMEMLKRMWAAIVDGATQFRGETVSRTLDGTTRHEILDMNVPEAHTDDYSRVYISGTALPQSGTDRAEKPE